MNMDPLYMLELRFDLIALHRFLHAQGLCGGEDGDIGYDPRVAGRRLR